MSYYLFSKKNSSTLSTISHPTPYTVNINICFKACQSFEIFKCPKYLFPISTNLFTVLWNLGLSNLGLTINDNPVTVDIVTFFAMCQNQRNKHTSSLCWPTFFPLKPFYAPHHSMSVAPTIFLKHFRYVVYETLCEKNGECTRMKWLGIMILLI